MIRTREDIIEEITNILRDSEPEEFIEYTAFMLRELYSCINYDKFELDDEFKSEKFNFRNYSNKDK